MVDIDTFRQNVDQVVSSIPRGKVVTYGQLAWLVGYPTYSRLVGRVLRGAPGTSDMPSHRVVNSQGRTVPHWPEQRSLLVVEGVTFKSNGCVDMGLHQWRPEKEEMEEKGSDKREMKEIVHF